MKSNLDLAAGTLRHRTYRPRSRKGPLDRFGKGIVDHTGNFFRNPSTYLIDSSCFGKDCEDSWTDP